MHFVFQVPSPNQTYDDGRYTLFLMENLIDNLQHLEGYFQPIFYFIKNLDSVSL
jgi:hypothetical protein